MRLIHMPCISKFTMLNSIDTNKLLAQAPSGMIGAMFLRKEGLIYCNLIEKWMMPLAVFSSRLSFFFCDDVFSIVVHSFAQNLFCDCLCFQIPFFFFRTSTCQITSFFCEVQQLWTFQFFNRIKLKNQKKKLKISPSLFENWLSMMSNIL